MYSVVLMMALSSGAEIPAWGGRGCHGCDGGYAACHGGYAACHGGCHGGLFARRGCHGGCHGGLFGRRHGCHGGCHGGGACSGGAVIVSCSGGYPGCTGGAPIYMGGCHGGAPYPGCAGGMAPPAMEGAPKSMPGKGPEKVPAPKSGEKETALPAPATIVVSLPAEAKLLVDDSPTTSTTELRVFASPALEPGKDYYYTLKGEMVRDGLTVTTSRQVRVRAGEETRVDLEFPARTVAAR